MLVLCIKSEEGAWKVRQEFNVTDVVKASNNAISVRRIDGNVTTHDLRDRDWMIVPGKAAA